MRYNPLKVMVTGMLVLAAVFGLVIALASCSAAGASPAQSVQPTSAVTDPCAVETGAFDVSATGFSGTAPTGTVQYKLFPCAKLAFLFLPGLAGPSNANTFTVGPLPSFLVPATISGQQHAVNGFDNGKEQVPMAVVVNAGSSTITYSFNGSWTGWTPSGSKGVGLQVITVFLD